MFIAIKKAKKETKNANNELVAGAFRSIGEKTSALFDRKKKDAEQIATEKAQDASHVLEEQVNKAGEFISGTQKSASDAADSGMLMLYLLLILSCSLMRLAISRRGRSLLRMTYKMAIFVNGYKIMVI